MINIGFVTGIGIWYQRELNTIKKKDDLYLQPIFEAFTNASESIDILKERYDKNGNGEITISIFLSKNLFSDKEKSFDLKKIEVEDSGIGFEDSEFERFINLRDDRKGFSNKGTGRIQFLHAFDKTTFESNFRSSNSKTGYAYRKITLSKCEAFIKKNAIIKLDAENEINVNNSSTKVTFETLLSDKDKNSFKTITALEVKEELIRHYLAGFCEKRNHLPKIKIRRILEDELLEELEILSEDIPTPNQEKDIDIQYSKIVENEIKKSKKSKSFNLKSFIISESDLQNNDLKLVSKGEIATSINLENLLPSDTINGNRYLFLLSGEYIDERDSDTRGNINLCKKKDFKKNAESNMFNEEEILLEDIEESTNKTIVSLYKEIADKSKEKDKSIKELEEMFLLNPKTINSLRNKINIGDSDDVILRKIYKAEAETTAERDAEIKHQIKNIETLDSTEKDYQEKLKKQVNELVKEIPLQNRTSLTQYVARRKVVLDLFDKILKKEIEKLKYGGRIDEDLMHNLIFQQHSDNPETSDLWLINEEYIYFSGTSESHLGNIKIKGEKILKEKLTAEEEAYRQKQQGDAHQRRTDILLFPKEAKCIIIELKAPDVNISDHLNQINRYASLIYNLSKDKYRFNTFYGYLIGENIDIDDIRDNDSDFIEAPNLDLIYRPNKNIVGKFRKPDASLYTEIIRYSTLLERAQNRNKIFINKLGGEK